MKTIALGFLATVIAASSALAGDEVVNKDYKQPVAPTTCFKDQEVQFDLFGSFMNLPYGHDYFYHDFNGNFKSSRLNNNERDGGGGGVGVNYFFLRYFGVGADCDIDSNIDGVANYTGKVIFRLPIEAGGFCIAPYVFGGGGGESFFDNGDYDHFHQRQTNFRVNSTVGAWMCGAGLEWRITPLIGIFAEGRYTWTARYNGEAGLNYDNDRARLGIRFAF
jgi:Outer membrane protein beta-barrel domain